MEMVRRITERYNEFKGEMIIYYEAHYNLPRSEILNTLPQDGIHNEKIFLNCRTLAEKDLLISDDEQIELFRKLLLSKGIEEKDIKFTLEDITMNELKEEKWIGEKISKFLRMEIELNYHRLRVDIINKMLGRNPIQGEMVNEVFGEDVLKSIESQDSDSIRRSGISYSLGFKSWWLPEFQEGLDRETKRYEKQIRERVVSGLRKVDSL